MMQTNYGSYLLRNWHHWNIYDPVLTSLSITTVIISRFFLLFHYFRYSFGKSFSGVSEDCLYLNVYAPKVFTQKFVHTVPSLLSLSYNCLFQSSIRMSATILTFELHSKIKFVTLTNALFMIMMTNGKPIFKKTHHNAIRCLDFKVSPPVVWFLETNRTQTCGYSKHSVQTSFCNGQLTLHCFTVERDTRGINYLRYFWKTHNNGTI